MAREPGIPSRKCECHDEPMDWNLDPRYTVGGFWYCSVKRRERQRQEYAAMSGLAYNRKLLRQRRNKAMQRRRAREASRG